MVLDMKYRDNMTEAELRAFKAELDALDAAYASAAAHDAAQPAPPDEWEDEMETLRRAALNRGRP
jgi:hypothetical protein